MKLLSQKQTYKLPVYPVALQQCGSELTQVYTSSISTVPSYLDKADGQAAVSKSTSGARGQNFRAEWRVRNYALSSLCRAESESGLDCGSTSFCRRTEVPWSLFAKRTARLAQFPGRKTSHEGFSVFVRLTSSVSEWKSLSCDRSYQVTPTSSRP
jgi:hypothetical protein